MDKTVMIAGVVAILAILAVTMILNPFEGISPSVEKPQDAEAAKDSTQEPSSTAPAGDAESTETTPTPVTPLETKTYGQMMETVKGNCTLYKHVAKEQYQCFGTAGNFSTMATNEYSKSDSSEYFCKATVYGCKLYQKVEFT